MSRYQFPAQAQDLSAYATTSAVAAGYQPLDSDLTSIAALTTTATGRALLTESVAQTGTGGLVRATSPTLVTPALGAATGTSVVLTGQSTASTVMLGDSTGPLLRNNAGTIEARNNANTGTAPFTAGIIQGDSIRTNTITRNSVATIGFFSGNISSPFQAITIPGSGGQITNSNGVAGELALNATINQTGTAGTTNLLINRTETALGSGAQLFFDFQVGGSSRISGTNTGNLTASGTIRLGTYTVGTLPSAASNTRALAFVTDSNLAFNSTNLGSTVTAGGSTLVPVFSNGTNWVIG